MLDAFTCRVFFTSSPHGAARAMPLEEGRGPGEELQLRHLERSTVTILSREWRGEPEQNRTAVSRYEPSDSSRFIQQGGTCMNQIEPTIMNQIFCSTYRLVKTPRCLSYKFYAQCGQPKHTSNSKRQTLSVYLYVKEPHVIYLACPGTHKHSAHQDIRIDTFGTPTNATIGWRQAQK